MTPALKKTITVEVVGSEVLLHDSSNNQVYRLPPSFRDTLDQVSSGLDVSNFDQLDELRDLGLLDEASSSLISRRSVLGGAGAVAGMAVAATALPVAAAASSQAISVRNDVFFWVGSGVGFVVYNELPRTPDNLFQPGSTWTLTLEPPSTLSTTGTVNGSGELDFQFPSDRPAPDLTIRGRLTGPDGEISNFFDIQAQPG